MTERVFDFLFAFLLGASCALQVATCHVRQMLSESTYSPSPEWEPPFPYDGLTIAHHDSFVPIHGYRVMWADTRHPSASPQYQCCASDRWASNVCAWLELVDGEYVFVEPRRDFWSEDLIELGDIHLQLGNPQP